MARKKLTVAWIAKDSARKASLKKRRVGLLKKVSELSALCDVNALVIIYSPNDKQPMMWPACPEVKEMLARFNSIAEKERNKKMTSQETYLNERVIKLRRQIRKHQMEHKEVEISNLMHYVYQGNGLYELNVNDLHSLLWFVKEKREEIRKRIEYCKQNNLPSPGSLPFTFAHTHDQSLLVPDQMELDHDHHYVKASVESAPWDQWFIDMMNNPENTAWSSSMAYQPFAASNSNGGNQLALVDPANYKANFSVSSGVETITGLQPHGDFRGLNTGGVGMAIGSPLPHFGGRSNRNDIDHDLQPYGNIKANSNANAGNHMGLPSKFCGGSIVGSVVGLSKPWPSRFYH